MVCKLLTWYRFIQLFKRCVTEQQVSSKAMAVGRLFSLQYDASTPFLLATAGSKGHVALWHSDEDEAISAR